MRRFLTAISLIALGLTDIAVAELDIVITEGIKRRPIAVVPFGWQGESGDLPLDIAGVIKADLYRSGRFAPIDEGDMLQKPTSGVDVDFDDWTILGVEAVVIGTLTQNGANAYTLQFQLFDLRTERQVFGLDAHPIRLV